MDTSEAPLLDMSEAPPPDPLATLRGSYLFDADFYLAALKAKGLTAEGDLVAHYLAHGEAAGAAPHPLFDPVYYGEAYPDVAAAGLNRLLHFVLNGASEGRAPHPLVDLALIRAQLPPDQRRDPLAAYLASRNGELKPHRLVDPAYLAAQQQRLDPHDERPALLFYLASDPAEVNPSTAFDGWAYAAQNPPSLEWHPLVHFARWGEAQEVVAPPARSGLARGALRRVLDQIEAAGRLDPDVVKPFADITQTIVSEGYDLARTELRLYRRLLAAAGRHAYAHVILVPWLKRGGADRAVIALARALLAADATVRVLIVLTQDDSVEALDAAPVSGRLKIAKVAGAVDEANDTFVAFCNFLNASACQHLYVVNSRFGWELVEKYGARLKARTYGFAFCQDYDDRGRRAGYAWTHLGRAIDPLTAVVTDNARVAAEFAADLTLDAADLAKFHVLPLPVDDRLSGLAAEQVAANLRQGAWRRPRVFWAGRLSAQKALDVAAEVARALPGIDICAYGAGEAGLASKPGNLELRGGFDDFADLPLHEASLFLHTARWEGLPNVILEAGAAGLPVIARDVGGVGDLIDETTGWLLPRDADGPAFAAAIRDALDRPEIAIARAQALATRISERHNERIFGEAVERLLKGGPPA